MLKANQLPQQGALLPKSSMLLRPSCLQRPITVTRCYTPKEQPLLLEDFSVVKQASRRIEMVGLVRPEIRNMQAIHCTSPSCSPGSDSAANQATNSQASPSSLGHTSCSMILNVTFCCWLQVFSTWKFIWLIIHHSVHFHASSSTDELCTEESSGCWYTRHLFARSALLKPCLFPGYPGLKLCALSKSSIQVPGQRQGISVCDGAFRSHTDGIINKLKGKCILVLSPRSGVTRYQTHPTPSARVCVWVLGCRIWTL